MSTISNTTNRKTVAVGVLILGILVAGFLVWHYRHSPLVAKFLGTATIALPNSSAQLVNETIYTCQDGKTIDASYFISSSTPNNSVSLSLSDGRSMTLPQAESGSGARYANADGSLVFWNKGNTAFVEEGANQTQTYMGCIGASNLLGTEGWNTYASTTMAISVRYPQGYTVQGAYQNTEQGPDIAPIPGVKFIIPASLYQGTNLSGFDSGVSVEQIASATNCSASAFLPNAGKETKETDNGVDYSVANASDAGAGNLYGESVYAIPGTSPCTAVRYFIHSTQIANYPTGTVKAFDKTALLAQFDLIRQSLVLGL